MTTLFDLITSILSAISALSTAIGDQIIALKNRVSNLEAFQVSAEPVLTSAAIQLPDHENRLVAIEGVLGTGVSGRTAYDVLLTAAGLAGQTLSIDAFAAAIFSFVGATPVPGNKYAVRSMEGQCVVTYLDPADGVTVIPLSMGQFDILLFDLNVDGVTYENISLSDVVGIGEFTSSTTAVPDFASLFLTQVGA